MLTSKCLYFCNFLTFQKSMKNSTFINYHNNLKKREENHLFSFCYLHRNRNNNNNHRYMPVSAQLENWYARQEMFLSPFQSLFRFGAKTFILGLIFNWNCIQNCILYFLNWRFMKSKLCELYLSVYIDNLIDLPLILKSAFNNCINFWDSTLLYICNSSLNITLLSSKWGILPPWLTLFRQSLLHTTQHD